VGVLRWYVDAHLRERRALHADRHHHGGDGESTFALPDLRGRVPLHQGTGPGLSPRVIGEQAGVETVTLTTNQIPAHNHPAQGQTGSGNQAAPTGAIWAASSLNQYSPNAPTGQMNNTLIQQAGGSQPHENMMPYLAISFIISLFGIFPTQN
jgi:microcystin-dependent protein